MRLFVHLIYEFVCFFTLCLVDELRYFNKTHHRYSLLNPDDTDNIDMFLGSKVKVNQ